MAKDPFVIAGLEEEDLFRAKMGRFSEAEERMMEQVIQGRGASLWRSFGRGRHYVDLRRPATTSSRPIGPDGGQTFTFSHRAVSKKRSPDLRLGERLYLEQGPVDPEAMRRGGAKFARQVSVKGSTGGWWVPPGTLPPKGARFARTADVAAVERGEAPGAGKRRQDYIERDDALETLPGEVASKEAPQEGGVLGAEAADGAAQDMATRETTLPERDAVRAGIERATAQAVALRLEADPSARALLAETGGMLGTVGNIAPTIEQRRAFWDAVERNEGSDGRIQYVIIAELPWEPEVGPFGRREIAVQLGAELEALGLRWHAAVHRPDDHSDPRNYHLHLIYHDRPARLRRGRWRFDARKCREVWDRDFIKRLRGRYAEIVNEVLARAGIARRLDARTYEEMGIEKIPGEHLGTGAAALERKGVVTVKGVRNASREAQFALRKILLAARDGLAADAARLDGGWTRVAEAMEDMSPRVRKSATAFVDAVARFTEAAKTHRTAEAVSAVSSRRARMVPRRATQAAVYGEEETLREEAAAVAGDLLKATGAEAKQASAEQTAARRARAQAERALVEADRSLEAEQLIAERARVMDGIERVWSKLTDGRVREKDWLSAAGRIASEMEGGQAGVIRARKSLLDALTPLGDEAAVLAQALENSFDRAGDVKRIELDQRLTKEEAAAVTSSLEALVAALEAQSAAAGERRRRRRIEDDESAYKRAVISEAEERGLMAGLRGLRREITEVDRKIIASQPAMALARDLGIGNRIGREGARLVERLREQTGRER